MYEGFMVVFRSGDFINMSSFTTLESAQMSADALPSEAKARVLGVCSKHGVQDFSDGYCDVCYDEYFTRHENVVYGFQGQVLYGSEEPAPMNVESTNNCWGWLCYFAAHLVKAGGILAEEVHYAIERESDRAKCKIGFQSDNQCVMSGNGWFYHHNALDESWTCDAEPNRRMQVEVFEEGLKYWFDRI